MSSGMGNIVRKSGNACSYHSQELLRNFSYDVLFGISFQRLSERSIRRCNFPAKCSLQGICIFEAGDGLKYNASRIGSPFIWVVYVSIIMQTRLVSSEPLP